MTTINIDGLTETASKAEINKPLRDDAKAGRVKLEEKAEKTFVVDGLRFENVLHNAFSGVTKPNNNVHILEFLSKSFQSIHDETFHHHTVNKHSKETSSNFADTTDSDCAPIEASSANPTTAWNLPMFNGTVIPSPHFVPGLHPVLLPPQPSHLFPVMSAFPGLIPPHYVSPHQYVPISVPKEIDYFKKKPPVCSWLSRKQGGTSKEVCGREFDTISDIVYHIGECHLHNAYFSPNSTVDQLHYCYWKECQRHMKPFKARYKLVNHLRVHTGERPFLCPFPLCGKRFARSENLKIHRRVHSGERPFLCEFANCTRKFANSSDRKKHMHTHNLESCENAKNSSDRHDGINNNNEKQSDIGQDEVKNVNTEPIYITERFCTPICSNKMQVMNDSACFDTIMSVKPDTAIIQQLEKTVNHHLYQIG